MSRLVHSIILALLMLLAQQGAVVHELSHLQTQAARSPSSAPDESAAHDALCLSCLAFAGVASAARPDAFQAPLLSFSPPQTAQVAVAALVAEALAPRSRGPPIPL
jgi:hypothetical protein